MDLRSGVPASDDAIARTSAPSKSANVNPRASAAPPTHIKGFDGLRAIAALCVFFEHMVWNNAIGTLGVWVFFCLSGYLIVGILHRSRIELESHPGSSRWRALSTFWVNRAARIFPVYYATLLVVWLAGLMAPKELLFYLSYLQNFYIGFIVHEWGRVTHFWSLAIEQQFYVFVAPVLIWSAKRRHRHLVAVAFVVCVFFIVAAGAAGYDPMKLGLLPLSNFAFMAVGAYVVLASPDDPVLRVLRHPATLAVGSTLVAADFVSLWLKYRVLETIPYRVYLWGLLFGGALVANIVSSQDGRLVRLLEHPALRWLGKVSYGFYVYHYLVPRAWQVSGWLHSDVPLRIPHLVWAGLQLVVALALAHLSWTYFEKPILALKRRPVAP
jgi:peptidoglycan/LPS O-acetylase OafA/YrhL